MRNILSPRRVALFLFDLTRANRDSVATGLLLIVCLAIYRYAPMLSPLFYIALMAMAIMCLVLLWRAVRLFTSREI